nr:FAD-dependent oxidoreductase [uncultured Alsobacter sp.]
MVGAGFVGLTAARHLAAAGLSVAVLEATRIGEGASGLNAGFVVPNFAKADPAAVLARLGEEAGHRLLLAVGSSADAVFDLVRDHAIDCDAEQTGWIHVAHDDAAARMLRLRADAWQALGRPVTFLDEGEARQRTAARLCRGALFDPSGGMLNPLALLHGLGRLAVAAGATLLENAKVSDARRDGGAWRLSAGGRSVRARTVLLCTNAFRGGLAGRLGTRLVPLPVYQIATAPLPAAEAARIAPHRNPLADTRANLFTCRLDRDNRLISGGMAILPVHAEGRMAHAIAARLQQELGMRHCPDVQFSWRGTAAISTDFLPHILRMSDGLFGAMGCNGRGIAVTAVVGRALADLVLGAAEHAVPVPVGGAGVPLGPFAPLMPSLAVAHARWQDARAG